MKKCIQFLTKVRVLNYEGNLSITNVLVYFLVISSFFWPVSIIFASIVVVLYGFGRFLNFKRGQAVDDAVKQLLDNQITQAKQIKDLKDQITSLSLKAGIMTPNQLGDLATKIRKF